MEEGKRNIDYLNYNLEGHLLELGEGEEALLVVKARRGLLTDSTLKQGFWPPFHFNLESIMTNNEGLNSRCSFPRA